MTKIKIEWLDDSSNCETCGMSYAEGAIVSFDGEVVIELVPHAACYDGNSYSEDQVYRKIIEQLGHEVTYNE